MAAAARKPFNGESKALYEQELKAVRARADRLHGDLEQALMVNKQHAERNNLVEYRLGKIEEQLKDYNRDMENVKDFVTRSGAEGVPMKTIFLIAGIVATVIGGIISVILKGVGV